MLIKDLKAIRNSTKQDILNKALKLNQIYLHCPENRKEITTEGGLNLNYNKNKIRLILNKFKKLKIRTSLFINPI